MWNKDDALEDTKCLIPDRCYAGMYQAVLEDCRTNGQVPETFLYTCPTHIQDCRPAHATPLQTIC